MLSSILSHNFVHRVGKFLDMLIRSFQLQHLDAGETVTLESPAPPGGGRFSPHIVLGAAEEPGYGRIPLYSDEGIAWPAISATISFGNNEDIRIGKAAEDESKLTSLLRVLVVSVIPPVKEANLRFNPPPLASRLLLSGEVSREVVHGVAKQWLHILSQLLSNVPILPTTEIFVLRRRKGAENNRRLSHAKAQTCRATSALGHESASMLELTSSSSSCLNDLARWDGSDMLADLIYESDSEQDNG